MTFSHASITIIIGEAPRKDGSKMEITACLFIDPEDCTSLRWCKEEDFSEFLQANSGLLYIGLFEIEAGKINNMYINSKTWRRKEVEDE